MIIQKLKLKSISYILSITKLYQEGLMFNSRKPMFKEGQIIYRINTNYDYPEAAKITKVLEYDKKLKAYEYKCTVIDTGTEFFFYETEYDRGEFSLDINEARTFLIKHKTAEIHKAFINTSAAFKALELAEKEVELAKLELINLLHTHKISADTSFLLEEFLNKKTVPKQIVEYVEEAIETKCKAATDQRY